MNLLLHNVGPWGVQIDEKRRQLMAEGVSPDQVDDRLDAVLPLRTDDSLRELGSQRFNSVATNLPYGR